MYRIEAQFSKGGKKNTYWERWGKNYTSLRRVLQAVESLKKDPMINGWWNRSGNEQAYHKIEWKFRPVHYYP